MDTSECYDNLTKDELILKLKEKDKILRELKVNQKKLTIDSNNVNHTEIITNIEQHLLLNVKEDRTRLNHAEIARYSRQLILPELGVNGQLMLAKASVLIVGCGGLGCPAAIYLAAAGVGCLGLIDYDNVEISNLHRQILHLEENIGQVKSTSVAESVNKLNSNVRTIPYHLLLCSSNALQIISMYDVILDCTDNVATRYLLNDTCVIANKPLVSGSALRLEGQLTVYHYKDGPCYRCLFPKPPPPETVTNCSDGGVIGVVPGIIGSLQALEAIKIISGIGICLAQKLLIFDASNCSFRSVKLRPHQKDCDVCGSSPSIKQLIDYTQFCGTAASDKDDGIKLLDAQNRITVKQYKEILEQDTPHVLVDVRLPVEQHICKLPNSINIPLKSLATQENIDMIKSAANNLGTILIYLVCRRGNDSQRAVNMLLPHLSKDYEIKDLVGGLTIWAKKIDPSCPIY